ncbi:MAG: CusA/CzcA family heavy metal efflux RND transporter, partial [Candidatus Omnitrophica bacterium]|nr:CusA/CzcA family heavy metal efflux RND transporter [Candidatus Omnitrophota bacterium]
VLALGKNNANVGAGYIEHAGEQYLIRVPGQVSTIADIERIIVTHNEGVPVYVRDVADVIEGQQLRTGAATANGTEKVVGTVFMLMGENSRVVAQRVDEKMRSVNKTLPPGVHAATVYNRMNLVDATIHTVQENLLLGALFVILVLFLFLGNIRAAVITAFIIPLSMMFTFTGMVQNKMSANLMSLGALDFGIIIDGAVIVMENCIRRLADARKELGRSLRVEERESIVAEASSEVRKATIFGELVIMIVYLPILTLTGIEGRMFVPMALAVIMALAGAMILSLTFIPAAVAVFLPKDITEREMPLMTFFKTPYRPTLKQALRHPILILIATFVLIASTVVMSFRMGREFIPKLDEGDFAMQAVRLPGISITQAVEMQKMVERTILEFPEVETVFSKIGTDEVASDPMPPNVADTFIMLKPKSTWPDPKRPKADLVKAVEAAVTEIPGNAYEFTQPIELRFNELISGVRSDIAVKLFGDDLNVLLAHAQEISSVLNRVDGASDVRVEQIGGLPMLTVDIDRNMLARYGLNMDDVQTALEIAVGGKTAGQVYQGDKRFDLVVRLPESIRNNTEMMANIPIPLPNKNPNMEGHERRHFLPLGTVASFKLAPGPNQISRENGKRRVVVSANVRGRDIGRFVTDAQRIIEKEVELPPGYWLDWGGQFEQMISAAKRLAVVVPTALFLIFVLLFIALGTIKDALLVFTCVPLALSGGVLALLMRDIPLSISAGIGFIAVSGVAVTDGLVMITFIKDLQAKGENLYDAVFNGAVSRLRPVLMTSFVAALGFVPMAVSTGRGAEVQRPLATVVIGGIISATFLTLLVLPVLYKLINHHQGEKE